MIWGCSLALLLAFFLSGTGCTSIYRRTRAELPPDPAQELTLRLAEAGQTEGLVRQGAAKLLKDLQSSSADVIQVDFDRLEAAGFDLDRRTLAAGDAAARTHDGAAAFTDELARLRRAAEAWLAFVREDRQADPGVQLQHLEALLRSSA